MVLAVEVAGEEEERDNKGVVVPYSKSRRRANDEVRAVRLEESVAEAKHRVLLMRRGFSLIEKRDGF